MTNVNFLVSLRAFFSMFATLFIAGERVAKTLDNTAKLGEVYTDGMVKEQELIQQKRIKDLEAKVAKKYEAEAKQWQI